MRKTVALPFVAIALASVIAAGCSGSNSYNPNANTAPTPVPSPTAACVLPSGETVQMVFPIPGQTMAPNLQGVVFAVSPNPLPTNWYVYATSSFGTTLGTNSIAFLATPAPPPGSAPSSTPTPLPTPSATPLVPTAIFETASIGNFANNTTTFTIYLANTQCSPGIPQGAFTTGVTDIPSPSPSPT